MQSPSSLIFLVLLGIWAAYFVQYWVRRRDHLATARSVEQFSAAMRVLERRDALPGVDLSQAAPRSYAVHPARTARPQVLVKRAVPAEPTYLSVSERVDGRGAPGAPADAVASAAPSVPSPAHPAGGRRPVPVPTPRPRVRPSRRVRGLMLLAAIVELLVIAPLVALAMLPLWALAPAVGAVAFALLWVRSGVRAERAMLRAHRRRAAELARRRAGAPVASRAGDASGAAREPSRRGVEAAADGPVAETHEVETGSTAADDVLVTDDVEAVDAPVVEAVVEDAADVMVPIVDEDDIPLTWDPVPVPRPTYTMKAKAERQEVAPAAVTPDPAPVVRHDEAGDTAYDRRRVAGA